MVCSLGTGRMAVMARLLAAGSLSQTIAEEIGQQKLANQCIYRELHEADEANLLDEEDMHVFGLKPMTDPLDLVCCNACKKPVKTSQYAAHAELCRSLNSAEETTLELDGNVGHRKPPRKERKKLLTSHITTPVAEQGRSVSIDAEDMAASESQLDGRPRRSSSFSMDTKRNPACVDVAFMMDGKGESPEHTDYSACMMPPPTKRFKFVSSSQHLLLSNDTEKASGLTKFTSAQDSFSIKDFQIESSSGGDLPNDFAIVSKFPGQTQGNCLLTKDIPVPLATKIYYSQRNNRLRSAVAHMYQASAEVSQETIIQLPSSSCKECSPEQVDNLLNKKREPSAFKPDQILAQSSELCLDKSGGCIPATSFSNQLSVDNILRPQTAPVLVRSKYLPKPYSFAGNSGQSLGSMQQASGSVPVL
ncbi:uncharacterized protein LOC110647455 isoform X2 [Hevea brasiliensis]|uniref:uncharacterized protein LOC110647455 isoform X2 n=1 Tax=Hevea brasiliensis TaxID=3981 RepID=UPI0025CE2CFC|nr:uncharacterized protein LOC110647455 isoform X2 [Hevea brasiliensis]